MCVSVLKEVYYEWEDINRAMAPGRAGSGQDLFQKEHLEVLVGLKERGGWKERATRVF